MVVLKFDYKGDVRRLTVEHPNYVRLENLVIELYSIKALPTHWVLKYVDQDGDLCSVTCDRELKEALTTPGILRFRVVEVARPLNSGAQQEPLLEAPQQQPVIEQTKPVVEEKKPEPVNEASKQEEGEPEGGELHEGVICDCCDQKIRGIRYKCLQCPDYDLCGECKTKSDDVHDPVHSYYALRKPTHYNHVRSFWPGVSNDEELVVQKKEDETKVEEPPKPRYYGRFVTDVSIPDGEVLAPGEEFVKIWRLRNNGHARWPEGSRLECLSGDVLSKEDGVVVHSAAPGEDVDVAVDMTAPKKHGRYVSNWRLRTPDGAWFGHKIWADICVGSVKVQVPQSPVVVAAAAAVKQEKKKEEDEPEIEMERVEDSVVIITDSVDDDAWVEIDEVEEDDDTTTTTTPTKVVNVVVENAKNVAEVVEAVKEAAASTVKEVFEALSSPPQQQQPHSEKVDDDVQGAFRQMLIELYDMGFTDKAQNREVLFLKNGDLLATVHELLNRA